MFFPETKNAGKLISETSQTDKPGIRVFWGCRSKTLPRRVSEWPAEEGAGGLIGFQLKNTCRVWHALQNNTSVNRPESLSDISRHILQHGGRIRFPKRPPTWFRPLFAPWLYWRATIVRWNYLLNFT